MPSASVPKASRRLVGRGESSPGRMGEELASLGTRARSGLSLAGLCAERKACASSIRPMFGFSFSALVGVKGRASTCHPCVVHERFIVDNKPNLGPSPSPSRSRRSMPRTVNVPRTVNGTGQAGPAASESVSKKHLSTRQKSRHPRRRPQEEPHPHRSREREGQACPPLQPQDRQEDGQVDDQERHRGHVAEVPERV